ncbi:unnamed protein product, partial [Rotaria magnacalcarata]
MIKMALIDLLEMIL